MIRERKDRKNLGIRIRGANGSDYMLSVLDIARDKAKKMAGDKNPHVIMATSIIPTFKKNPEKILEWARTMKPENMTFIKVKTAREPTSEELAKDMDKGILEGL